MDLAARTNLTVACSLQIVAVAPLSKSSSDSRLFKELKGLLARYDYRYIVFETILSIDLQSPLLVFALSIVLS